MKLPGKRSPLAFFYAYNKLTSIPINKKGINGTVSLLCKAPKRHPQIPDSNNAIQTVMNVNHPPVHSPNTATAIPSPKPICSLVKTASKMRTPPVIRHPIISQPEKELTANRKAKPEIAKSKSLLTEILLSLISSSVFHIPR